MQELAISDLGFLFFGFAVFERVIVVLVALPHLIELRASESGVAVLAGTVLLLPVFRCGARKWAEEQRHQTQDCEKPKNLYHDEPFRDLLCASIT